VWAVYWDVNDERGIAFDIKSDREGEPNFVSRYQLVNGGWKKRD